MRFPILNKSGIGAADAEFHGRYPLFVQQRRAQPGLAGGPCIRLATLASRTAAASTVSPEMVNWTGNGRGMVFLHDAQQHLNCSHYFFYEQLRTAGDRNRAAINDRAGDLSFHRPKLPVEYVSVARPGTSPCSARLGSTSRTARPVPTAARQLRTVPVHSFETPLCVYAAIGIGLICSART